MVIKVVLIIIGIVFILFGYMRLADYSKLKMMSDINDPKRKKDFLKRLRLIAFGSLTLGILLLGYALVSMINFKLVGTQTIELIFII